MLSYIAVVEWMAVLAMLKAHLAENVASKNATLYLVED